jgi:hypothetical protein
MRVLIENSSGNGSTSIKRARSYVRRKRAEWVEEATVPTICFTKNINHHHYETVLTPGALYSAGRDTLARYDQARRIPMVGDVRRLFTTKSP